ncbi:integrator complex subunit 9-like protein [Dermatophagoides farinae]|uniref:Integrator complex subunit 9-like protein n=1 Tax=Dermatophagoides farinae TaxID=6954 RepID=A0A9D4P9V6_DERFA|nr:integrator complex subunit 9-like [Dermatophagoides farinae]KAH7646743.1 integrator complex subunit 9-like protein [Dermatophagoides farinae]
MKFISLSGNPNYPCNVIKFKSTHIMLDCALDSTTVLSFLPMTLVHSNHFNSLPSWNATKEFTDPLLENEIKECLGKIFVDSAPEFCLPEFSCIDMKNIDVILISNYRSMLALPFITERSDFSGFVYATEPSMNLGRLFMEELVTYIERNPKLKRATAWKNLNIFQHLPFPCFPDSILPTVLENIYSMDEISSCLSKVKPVAFSEKICIFGSLHWYPVSTGYCLGSSNWIIESAHEKIVNISSSSTYTTHIRPMDHAPLKNADLVILTSLSLAPTTNPNTRLNEFCDHVEKTLKSGGNVLIPCYSSGKIYDLFECLNAHLDSVSLGGIPIFFISPIAEHSLAYSNIMAEWLSELKQNRAFIPEEPFPHGQLVKNGRIKHFVSLSEESFNNEFRMPCIVFTGHPSLRFGDVVHFIELWGSNPTNMILMTEPEFPCLEALSPYQPLSMKIIYCPIDTRLTFIQANKIIRDIKPKNLVLPYQYTRPFSQAESHNKQPFETMIEADCKMFPYHRKETIKLPIKCKYERLLVDSELISSLTTHEIADGIKITTITGILEAKDNKFRLGPITKSYRNEFRSQMPTRTLPPNKYLIGMIDMNELLRLLAHQGYLDIVLNKFGDKRFRIEIRSKGITIDIDDETKSIMITAEDWQNDCRLAIRKLLAKCLIEI